MQKSKLQFKSQNYLIVIALFFIATPVLAAEIFYDAEVKEVKVGTEFEIGIFLNAEKENINALEGVVRFPIDLLEFKKIRDGNSIVNFWIIKPRIDTNTNTNQHEIIFSGITPGGFQGKRGLLFFIIFQAKQEGNGEIEIQRVEALLNDGEGTETKVSVKNLLVSIRSDISVPSWVSPEDNEPPESFAPEIATDPVIFEGKHFLVFATQDKKSGILHYEVKEARQRIFDFSNWVEAESPYVLQDQELRSHIFVKAVDKAGNKRIVKVLPRNPPKWYENYENWIIILIVFGILYLVFRICVKFKRYKI